MNSTREPASGTHSTSATNTPAAAPSSRLAVQLRGKPLDEQVATLAPRPGAQPVQRQEPKAQGTAPDAAPSAGPSPSRLAGIASRMLGQLGTAFASHIHTMAVGPTSAPTVPVTVPRVLTGTESDLAAVAGAIRGELTGLAVDLSVHLHSTATGPTGPSIIGPMLHGVTGAETDLLTLVDHFQADLDALRNWFVADVHPSPVGPTSPALVPLVLDDTELVTLRAEIAAAAPKPGAG